jgi:hypothetical protein
MLSTSEAASVPFGRVTANTEQIHISYNMGEVIYRVIHDITTVVPSRFNNGEDDDDQSGWVWLNGRKVPVETAYYGDVVIWKLAEQEP